jgi:fatty acid desaturase
MIRWYRSPVNRDELKELYRRNDLLASLQTLGYLGLLCLSGGFAIYSAYHWRWPATAALVFVHGTFFAFQINAVHELGHNTVFRAKTVNQFFMQVFAFLGWINPYLFFASHQRHHYATLHPPEDLEVVLPMETDWSKVWRWTFINLKGPWAVAAFHIRIVRGHYVGEWELHLFPEGEPEKRRIPRRWALFVLLGHATILAVSLALHWWMVPVVVTLAPYYGAWLHFLCNQTQHIGLSNNVEDYRLCCRTFLPNPFVRFLYWQMNYHIEHHMYVGVPCYYLGRLHRLIEKDLPPTPVGLLQTWKGINEILRRQKLEPGYAYVPNLPEST